MVIVMKNVSCIRGDRYILRSINWSVREGEHWSIIGLNGSGKTTLLKLIHGDMFPSEGTMTVLGKNFGEYDWRDMRRKIGFASSFLQERLYENETALEIVLSGLYATFGLYDTPGRRDKKRAENILDLLNCGHAAGQQYRELSQGEKQKVLIGRAVISSPRILIMDEPCAGLDLVSREQLLSSVAVLGTQHPAPSIIFVTHHVEEVLPIFNRTLLLRGGEIHSAGETKRVIGRENLSSFLERPVDVRRRNGRVWISI